MVSGCIFCKLAEENSEDKIYENDNFFSVPDISPSVKGHCIVISKKHFKTILDLPSTLGSELLDCIKKTALIIMKRENATGVNIGNNSFYSAGQIINHIHFHILPRKEGDGLSFSLKKK